MKNGRERETERERKNNLNHHNFINQIFGTII